jgi:hypothetical protein
VVPAVFRVKEVPSASTDVRKRDPLAIRRSPVGLKSNRIPARWLLRFDSLKPLGRALQTTGKVTLDGKRRSPQKVRKAIESGELERIRIEAVNTDKKMRVAPPAEKRIAYAGGDAGREIVRRGNHDRIF